MSNEGIREYIRRQHEETKERGKTFWVPEKDSEEIAFFYDEEPEVLKEGGYTFYAYKVRVHGETRLLRLFLNQAGYLEELLSRSKSRDVKVKRTAKGTFFE